MQHLLNKAHFESVVFPNDCFNVRKGSGKEMGVAKIICKLDVLYWQSFIAISEFQTFLHFEIGNSIFAARFEKRISGTRNTKMP